MSLFELMEWRGHRSPEATRHYARVTPTKLAKAYVDTAYFQQNMATVEILLDLGALAQGEKDVVYYDLGYGLCANPEWWQCRHRMACARCDFFRPREQAQVIRTRDGIRRLKEEIPLTDDELRAASGDEAALTALIERNADVPTPAGRTPRELGMLNGHRGPACRCGAGHRQDSPSPEVAGCGGA